MSSASASTGARARARAAVTADILGAARRQLGEVGSSGLSLRAIARELGMASSAMYRYFPSRDDLLTALIIEAYDDIADAVDAALAQVPPSEHQRRWLTCAAAARDWAVERPHQWALIFGSPVPGYRAPSDTIDPAARLPLRLVEIVGAAADAGYQAPDAELPVDPADHRAINAIRAGLPVLPRSVEDAGAARALMAWIHLVGAISMELFGHLNNVVPDYRAWFELQMRAVGRDLGLPAKD